MTKVEKFYNELRDSLSRTKYGVEMGGIVDDVIEKSRTLYKNKQYSSEFKGSGFCITNKEFYTICFNILDDNKVALQYIETQDKGKGIGSDIMKAVISTAKRIGVTIKLDAIPAGGSLTIEYVRPNLNTRSKKENWDKATDRLIKFYERFGFSSWHKNQPFRMRYLVA